jgi:hypothetical protein
LLGTGGLLVIYFEEAVSSRLMSSRSRDARFLIEALFPVTRRDYGGIVFLTNSVWPVLVVLYTLGNLYSTTDLLPTADPAGRLARNTCEGACAGV